LNKCLKDPLKLEQEGVSVKTGEETDVFKELGKFSMADSTVCMVRGETWRVWVIEGKTL
jgi:hypothetical protein